MLLIPSTVTTNLVSDATFGNSGTPYVNGYVIVTGAAVLMTLYHGKLGARVAAPEVEIGSASAPILVPFLGYEHTDPIQGVGFRSAVSGSPGTVKGALFEPGAASIGAAANGAGQITPPGGGGIQFDTDPQTGDWLVIETTGSNPTAGSNFQFDGVGIHATSAVVGVQPVLDLQASGGDPTATPALTMSAFGPDAEAGLGAVDDGTGIGAGPILRLEAQANPATVAVAVTALLQATSNKGDVAQVLLREGFAHFQVDSPTALTLTAIEIRADTIRIMGLATSTHSETILIGRTNAATIGFMGSAGTTRPNVTGSRGGNAALASLLTGLANLGLITDSSSP